MAARTRLGVDGYGVRRAGSFAGKSGPALVLLVNPKWLVAAMPRSFAKSADGRLFGPEALARNFAVEGKSS